MPTVNNYTAKELEFTFNEWLAQIKDQSFYKPELIRSGDRAGSIIDVPVYKPLTIAGFCLFANISVQTFNTYCNAEVQKDNELLETSVHIREHIQDSQIAGAIAGHYNSNIVSRLNSLKDASEIELTGSKEVINITIQGKDLDLT
jgi:hypothetical protein